MGKLLRLVLLAAALAGAGFAGYNALVYDRVQPFPLAWTLRPEELELLELERLRAALVAKLGSTRRVGALGAIHMPPEVAGSATDAVQAELTALDARIAALRAALSAQPGR